MSRWKQHVGTLLMVLVALLGVQWWQTRHVPVGLAPDLPLTLLRADGSTHVVTLGQWRTAHPGQPVVLHFWAEWCPICRTEEHSITRLSQDWPVLTVAMQSGNPSTVQRILRQRRLNWQTVVDPQGDIARAFGFQAVPAMVVIDAKGRLRNPTAGYTSEIGMRLRIWWIDLVG